ncbi:MAG: T9SS type A sorting domain-containing protein, partial [Chitinophagaceae bacterium]
TRDGGMLLTGTLDVSFVNYETLLIKLDGNGNVQWTKTIGDLRVWETGRRIIETPEQDFLIVGNKQTEFDINSALYVLKIDKNGNKLWSKHFADGITTDLGYDAVLTADQQYLFAGSAGPFSTREKDLLLIKTDKQGNRLWQKKQDLHLIDEAFRLQQAKAGGYFIAGTTGEPKAGVLEKFIYIMKIDEEGNRQWIDYFGTKGLQTMHPQLVNTPWGDTLLMGTTHPEYGKPAMFFVKLNDRNADPVSDPQEEIMLFPNPTASNTTLQIKDDAEGAVFISVYDQTGKIIRQLKREKNSQVLQENIDLTGSSPGVYYVTVLFNGKTTVRKLLVMAN